MVLVGYLSETITSLLLVGRKMKLGLLTASVKSQPAIAFLVNDCLCVSASIVRELTAACKLPQTLARINWIDCITL